MQALDIASQSMPFMDLQLRALAISLFSLTHNTNTSEDEISMPARSLWQHSREYCVDNDMPGILTFSKAARVQLGPMIELVEADSSVSFEFIQGRVPVTPPPGIFNNFQQRGPS
jgi:hypothetical protein